MDRKPRIFIASSKENLPVAEAVNLNLDHDAEGSLWRNGFKLSTDGIESLVGKAKSVDFALFIFSPDDITTMRGEKLATVRDNVLFELGLFIGAVSKERCFILKPRNTELHFPTDLLGMEPADYDPNRTDGDLASAVAAACTRIKTRMKELGIRLAADAPLKSAKFTVNVDSDLNELDIDVLSRLLGTATQEPDGYPMHRIKDSRESSSVDLCIIKLERLGYIDREIKDVDDGGYNSYTCYVYTITNDGIEILLKKDEQLQQINSKAAQVVEEDEIPF